MMYELDLGRAGLSNERLRETFVLQMGFDQDPDWMDIFCRSENRPTLLVGNINMEDRLASLDGHFILTFLSNFTPTELGKIIPLLVFFDGSEGDTTR